MICNISRACALGAIVIVLNSNIEKYLCPTVKQRSATRHVAGESLRHHNVQISANWLFFLVSFTMIL